MKKLFKLNTLFLILYFLNFSCINLFCETNKKSKTKKIETIANKIKDINFKMFTWNAKWIDFDNHKEYLKWQRKEILNPKPRHKRMRAFHLLSEQEKKQYLSKRKIPFNNKEITTTWEDLDLFAAPSKDENYVAQAIDRTKTEVGKVSLYKKLALPTANTEKIKARQEIIKTLLTNDKLRESLDKIFSEMDKGERVLLAIWERQLFKYMDRLYYFSIPGTEKLNDNTTALLIKYLYNRSSSLLQTSISIAAGFALITYGILNTTNFLNIPQKLKQFSKKHIGYAGFSFPYLWKIKNPWIVRSLVAIIAGYFCSFYGIWELKWISNMFLTEEITQTFLIKITQYMRKTIDLYELIKTNPKLSNFKEFKGIKTFFEEDVNENDSLNKLLNLIQSETLKNKASLFSHKGIILTTNLLLKKTKKKLENLVEAVGNLDAYLSCAKLFNEFEKKQVKFCFANFAKSEKPFIKAEEFWHPLININKVVTNNLIVGTENYRPNMVITGPNAGGKSCILKSITLCLIMAQTLGIAPASSLTFTPFKSISTYLNITDNVNEGNSLFKAEVLRTQNLIDKIKNSKEGEFNFTVFDEIFNGTSPVEGAAAAYSVATHIGTFKNSISLIATHFPILTNLENNTETFSNYKVTVNQYKNGNIEYPYKLQQGASDQHIALDILKNQGFNGSVIEDAEKIIAQDERTMSS
ncbi:hypothetical protein KAT08_04070 [Candidatus Babeliales bacterium]|nr:hypothetical protein [Candidatus Babeliales bacterium]